MGHQALRAFCLEDPVAKTRREIDAPRCAFVLSHDERRIQIYFVLDEEVEAGGSDVVVLRLLILILRQAEQVNERQVDLVCNLVDKVRLEANVVSSAEISVERRVDAEVGVDLRSPTDWP